MNQEKKNYALPIAMMFALFFMIALVTGLPSPMGVIAAKQFNATNFESQLGFFANFIAYAFMGIPAGLMLKKIGYKKTALAAIIVGFIGVGIQFLSGKVESFPVYLAGAFVSGFSVCMLNTVVNPMLNTLGGGGKKGNQLLQFGGSINSIGATIAPMLVGWLMGAEAGRTIAKATPALFLAMGIFALAFIVLYFVNIPEPDMQSNEAGAKKGQKDKYGPMSFRHFILGTVAIFIYVGIEVGIPSTANLFMTTLTTEQAEVTIAEYEKQQADNTYLVTLQEEDKANFGNEEYTPKVIGQDTYNKAQKVVNQEVKPGLGIAAGIAGTLVGLYWLLMLVGRLVGASLGNHFSSKSMLTFVACLGLILLIGAIFLPTSMGVNVSSLVGSDETVIIPINVIFLILCGLCTSVMWGGIFNLAVEGLGKYTAAASGIFMVMVCGGGIIPLIQGYVADVAGYLSSYWVMFICVAYLLWYALIGCKNVNKNIPVE